MLEGIPRKLYLDFRELYLKSMQLNVYIYWCAVNSKTEAVSKQHKMGYFKFKIFIYSH